MTIKGILYYLPYSGYAELQCEGKTYWMWFSRVNLLDLEACSHNECEVDISMDETDRRYEHNRNFYHKLLACRKLPGVQYDSDPERVQYIQKLMIERAESGLDWPICMSSDCENSAMDGKTRCKDCCCVK